MYFMFMLMYLIYMLVFIVMCILLGHVRYVHLMCLRINVYVIVLDEYVVLADKTDLPSVLWTASNKQTTKSIFL